MLDPVSIDNYNIIKDLVKNHFSLSDDSLQRFNDSLDKPFVDNLFKLDNDLRYSIKLNYNDLEKIDSSWKMFNKLFSNFILDYKITYKNYLKSKVIIKKNEVKILKLLKEYYLKKGYHGISESYINDTIEYEYNGVIKNKLPKLKEYYLIISVNYADFFMSATEEKWSSCFSFNSQWEGVYWAGLPGLSVDKNRFVVYLTNKEYKIFNNIKTYKMYYRSFGIIDKENLLRYVKFYPNNLEIENLNNTFYKFHTMDTFEKSKYSIDLLNYKNDTSCYIFQDNTTFNSMKNPFLVNDDKGMKTIINNNIWYGVVFRVKDSYGLKYLIDNNEELIDYYVGDKGSACYFCEEIYDEAEMIEVNNRTICNSCFEEHVYVCDNCEETVFDYDIYFKENQALCYSCFIENGGE